MNFTNAVAGGTLKIYKGNTVAGTPIYTQSFVGSGQQEITLSRPINVVADQQYTFFTNETCKFYPFSTYAGGSTFHTTISYPGDLWMKVILETLHG